MRPQAKYSIILLLRTALGSSQFVPNGRLPGLERGAEALVESDINESEQNCPLWKGVHVRKEVFSMDFTVLNDGLCSQVLVDDIERVTGSHSLLAVSFLSDNSRPRTCQHDIASAEGK